MKLSRTALAFAAFALVPAGAVMAQPSPATPPAPSAAPSAAPAPTPVTSDQAAAALEGFELVDIRFDEEDDGRYEFEARDTDGRDIDIDINRDGSIHQFDVDDDRRATSVNLAVMLPQALQDALAERGIVDVIEFDTERNHYSIEGYNSDGREIEVEIGFDALPGTIAVQTDRGPAPAQVDAQALTSQVENSGYGVESVESHPRHVEMIAINPEGERVRLHVDFDGVVYRETLMR